MHAALCQVCKYVWCPCRRKTILAATHHMRQPLHREFSPSQDSISDSGSREGVGVQQQQQGSRLQLRSGAPSLRGPPRLSGAASLVVPQSLSGPPSLSGEPSLSGAPSLSPQAPGAFATGEAFKRRGSAVPKQVMVFLGNQGACMLPLVAPLLAAAS
eukprot:scaffold156959_cov18-Tisochrysis_lutea.AAC.2